MSFTILLAEDNESDAELIAECLQDWQQPVRLEHVRDGAAALERLQRSPAPHLVLLDLKMPQVDGLNVLEVMKEDEVLRVIPVIVLTSSAAHSDVLAAYARHANTFFTKPMDIDGYERLLELIGRYWVESAEIPV